MTDDKLNNKPHRAIPQIPTNGPQCSELDQEVWHGLDLSWHPDLAPAVQSLCAWYRQETGALVLNGGYGCGKTHLAKAVYEVSGGPTMQIEWRDDGPISVRSATYYAEPDLLEDIRKSFRDGTESKIVAICQRARLLILDDLGAAYVKDESQRWYEDLIWRILDPRAKLKTLITTNLTPPELKSRIGGRGYSRLQEMLGRPENIINMFPVPDYRARNWASRAGAKE